MKTSAIIKDGLEYSITKTFIKRANRSSLKRNLDNLALSCQFSGLDCNMIFTDTPVSHDIEFIFQLNYLKSYTADFDLTFFPETLEHEVCCNTQMILHEIINCRLQAPFKNIFMESKALSLLLCFQKCCAADVVGCSSCKFLTKSIEKSKILKAREIILNRLDNPPTIPALSVQIGINQCYLKKGFKELFGITVYDFVQEQRMMKAKMLLSTTDFSIAEVADQVGFSSASNFSSAFKKFTGIFPSGLQHN